MGTKEKGKDGAGKRGKRQNKEYRKPRDIITLEQHTGNNISNNEETEGYRGIIYGEFLSVSHLLFINAKQSETNERNGFEGHAM